MTHDLFDTHPHDPSRRKVYEVFELTALIRDTLEDRFGTLWVEGEVSNLRQPGSGHIYFTLKDQKAQLAAVFFRGDQVGMNFTLKDGQQVRVMGDITVYERDGRYQVRVRRAEEAGRGALLEQLEKRKAALAAEGLFDATQKKPLPLLPRRIGVVTSPTGAAIRDIIQVLTRRFPGIQMLLAGVPVQGEGAAERIARAIDHMGGRGDRDVLIVGRGGGSLEDLWAFNEECVVRAIASCPVPVITGIGHEIDVTLSDLAADVRAATPSAAAEQAVRPLAEWRDDFAATARQLRHLLTDRVHRYRVRVTAAGRSYGFQEPVTRLQRYRQELRQHFREIRHGLVARVQQHHQFIDEAGLRLTHHVQSRATMRRQDVVRLAAQLRALSPQAVLERGYSMTRDSRDRIVRRAGDVAAGESITTRLASGRLRATVDHVEPGEADDRQG